MDRISEIDERIEDLEDHVMMWRRAGGQGYRMADQATIEIKELKLEKNDLINGTHSLEIYHLERDIKMLGYKLEDAGFFSKFKLNKELKSKQEELNKLMEIDKNIEIKEDAPEVQEEIPEAKEENPEVQEEPKLEIEQVVEENVEINNIEEPAKENEELNQMFEEEAPEIKEDTKTK